MLTRQLTSKQEKEEAIEALTLSWFLAKAMVGRKVSTATMVDFLKSMVVDAVCCCLKNCVCRCEPE